MKKRVGIKIWNEEMQNDRYFEFQDCEYYNNER